MKIKRRDFDKVLFTLLALILCSWAFFSGISIAGLLVCLIVFLVEILIIVLHSGKVAYRKIYLLWFANVALMFLYADRLTTSVIAYNTTYAVLILMLVIVSAYSKNNEMDILLKSLIIFSLISCAIVVIESVMGERIEPVFSALLSPDNYYDQMKALREGTGYTGLASAANIISHSAALLIFYNSYYTQKRNLIIRVAIYILAIYSALIVGERSNIIFIPLAIMLTYYLGASKNKANRFFILLFVCLCLLGFIILISPFLIRYNAFFRIMNSIATYSEGGDISNGRARLYESAIASWKSSPVYGHGWFYYFNNNFGLLRALKYDHVHNLLLELLCDTGIIGTVFILLPLLTTVVFNIRALKSISEESSDSYKFTIAYQIFFLMDSMLHVTFYSLNVLVIYFMVITIFYAKMIENRK